MRATSNFDVRTVVGSEEARSIALALASVRRSNWACFPAPSFHEDAARWGVLEGIINQVYKPVLAGERTGWRCAPSLPVEPGGRTFGRRAPFVDRPRRYPKLASSNIERMRSRSSSACGLCR